MTLTRQRGWSNAKRLPAVHRVAEASRQDPLVAGALAFVVVGSSALAVVLPKPVGFLIPIGAIGVGGAGWNLRRGERPVSFLIDRAHWESRREALAAIPGLTVEMGGAAKALGQDGTVYDVRLTCRRRLADAVQRVL